MYLAKKQIKISIPGEDGKTKVMLINPGQEIPGVEKWPYQHIIAHLNLELIQWKGEEMEAPHNSHLKSGQVIPFASNKKVPEKAPTAEVKPVPKPKKKKALKKTKASVEEPKQTKAG